jgi:hypothetical protein
MRRKSLLEGWAGWFLNIHLPTAHAMETCWCIGTKRELKLPDTFYTKSRAMADLVAINNYFAAVLRGNENDNGQGRSGSDSSDQPST